MARHHAAISFWLETSGDDLTPRARRLTTANTVRRDPDGRLVGDIAKERWELANQADHELDELAGIYRAKGLSPELARQLAMHISFSRPTYSSRDQVPAELVAAEREILEGVSIADAVAQRFPTRIKRLLDNPSAWR